MNTVTALLMLKAPVEGRVKTRLACEIGAPAAVQAYRKLVDHQLRQIPHPWSTRICFAPANAEASVRKWLGESYEYVAQGDGDLGARLAAAVAAHFSNAASPLIILGGDCPYLDSTRLLAAAAALTDTDAVFVPALDGGYCLLGLRAPEPHLFHAIAWSTDAVLAQTRERLRERGLKWREMDPLEDVDDGGSWRRALATFPDLAGGAL